MKSFKVRVNKEAEEDLRRYTKYVKETFANSQAAKSILLDFRETKRELATIAASIAEPENNRLKEKGLKRINFRSHNYFLLFKIVDRTVYITNVFHGYEDYESKLR